MTKLFKKKDILNIVCKTRKEAGKGYVINCYEVWASKLYHRKGFVQWKWQYFFKDLNTGKELGGYEHQNTIVDILYRKLNRGNLCQNIYFEIIGVICTLKKKLYVIILTFAVNVIGL